MNSDSNIQTKEIMTAIASGFGKAKHTILSSNNLVQTNSCIIE
jgi:hypothetical protein